MGAGGAQAGADPLAQFSGGLLGEGDRDDPPDVHALLDDSADEALD